MDADTSEWEVLSACALRIDGYAWAIDQGLEREQLMKPFWHPEIADALFEQPWDYQWAAWFMQQRSMAWTGSRPSGDALRLWRRLFLALADKQPSPPFDRGGPDGDGAAPKLWKRRYARRLAELRRCVQDRLSRDATIDEPMALLPPAIERAARPAAER